MFDTNDLMYERMNELINSVNY